jgi:hypothetical protein
MRKADAEMVADHQGVRDQSRVISSTLPQPCSLPFECDILIWKIDNDSAVG